MRVGPDWQNKPTNITTCDGNDILWLPSVRYLGVYIAANRVFRCVFDNAKKSFYRAFNAVFGKIGGRASEEVVLHIMKSKCMPLLLYGLEVCPMKKRQLNSLEFVLTNCFMKIFKTKSKDVVIECMSFFDFPNIGTAINARREKFLRKFIVNFNVNSVCCIFIAAAQTELNVVRALLRCVN
jgi:hypothetical protein